MSTVTYTEQGHIGTVTLNRPNVLNAMSDQLIDELLDQFVACSSRNNIRVVVLRGEGRAFCAGRDLKDATEPQSDDRHTQTVSTVQKIARTMLSLDKPIVASLHGYAVGGGCILALGCDIRIASDGTKLGFPETKVGTVVNGGATYLLSRLVGTGKAKELLLTGDMIDAHEAERIGLVNCVVPYDKLDETVMRMANRIAGNFPLSVRLTKQLIDAGLESSLEAQLASEIDASTASFASGDRKVGMKNVAGSLETRGAS